MFKTVKQMPKICFRYSNCQHSANNCIRLSGCNVVPDTRRWHCSRHHSKSSGNTSVLLLFCTHQQQRSMYGLFGA